MAKKKYIDYKKQQQDLFKRTEGYAAEVRAIYLEAMGEIINLVKGTELEDGKPFSFAEYGYSEEVTPILRNMYSRTYQVIRGGVQKEWLQSNEHNDELVKSVFGEHSIEDHHFARYFLRNKEAMDAFFARKTGEEGLNLSQKVWKYNGMFKEELENALDLAIGEGTPANRLATKIKGYLHEPDKFYRRFRVKIGEDENGNPIYGRIWKRRIWDKESESYKWVNDDPKKYHPGQGVYRSSYRNAQRLARTETNIAYREADFTRWQQLDFVVGVEIKLSNNHPVWDICDDLKGVYPKGFKWVGWHPNCRCYMVPVLAKEEELDQMLDKILNGEDPGSVVTDSPKDLPDQFQTWVKDNEERYHKAEAKGTLPYFIKDNKKAVDQVLKGLTPEEEKALSFADVLVNPLELLKRHSIQEIEQLHSAVTSKLSQMLKGDLSTQKSTLEFEINWVKQHKKYSTWEAAAEAYQKALDSVNLQLEKRAFNDLCAGMNSYLKAHPKSKVVKTLRDQIYEALGNNDMAKAKELLANADDYILKYNQKKAKKAAASITDLEKYCDQHRTYTSPVVDNRSFNEFQNRSIAEVSEAWKNGSNEARRAVRGYTDGTYDDINSSYWRDKKGCRDGKLMDEILDQCFLAEDTVLRRGCSFSEMRSIFGDDFGKLMDDMNISELNKLAGHRGINEGFISTSWDMEGGFWKSVDLRIFAPKGTQAFYAKPVSGFGDGHGAGWDGKSASTNFCQGRENETIVHRGYEYRFVKAEKGGHNGSRITIYIELLTRNKRVVK